MNKKAQYRYLVFGGSYYYPNGGTRDLVFYTNDLDKAISFCDSFEGDWWEILNVSDLTYTTKYLGYKFQSLKPNRR